MGTCLRPTLLFLSLLFLSLATLFGAIARSLLPVGKSSFKRLFQIRDQIPGILQAQ